jgi:hypothetical protein
MKRIALMIAVGAVALAGMASEALARGWRGPRHEYAVTKLRLAEREAELARLEVDLSRAVVALRRARQARRPLLAAALRRTVAERMARVGHSRAQVAALRAKLHRLARRPIPRRVLRPAPGLAPRTRTICRGGGSVTLQIKKPKAALSITVGRGGVSFGIHARR